MTKTQRPKNAYNLYCQNIDEKQKIKSTHPDWTGVQILKEMANNWNALSVEDKAPYKQQASQAKDLFLKYEIESGLVTEEQVKKRPKSAYIHFSYNTEVREKIKKEHPEWKVTEIAKYLGTQWNSMEDKERQKWVKISQKEKEELEKNPIYYTKKKKIKPVESSSDNRISQLEQLYHQLSNEVKNLKNLIENSS